MTDKEINIAIAEECGWCVVGTDSRDPSVYDGGLYPFSLRSPDGKFSHKIYATKEAAWSDAPDFPNDLNAMHKAEKVGIMKMEGFFRIYVDHLVRITGRINGGVDATARQRAEAFLRTIGKWKD